MQGGKDAEKDPGNDRDRHHKQEHMCVHANGNSARQGVIGQRRKISDGRPAQTQPQQAAQESQQHTFSQQLSDQDAALRSQRRANSNFFPPRQCAREQQAGYIRTGNQQHHAHRDGQYQQLSPNIGHHRILQISDNCGEIRLRIGIARIVFLKLLVQNSQLCRSAFPRNSRTQPRNNAQIADTLTQPLRRKERVLKIARTPDVSRSKEWELDSSGQYSNDVVWIAVQGDSLIENSRIAAEPGMPELVTDYDHRLARWLSFIQLKEAAALRPNAQYIKKVWRHSGRWHLERL